MTEPGFQMTLSELVNQGSWEVSQTSELFSYMSGCKFFTVYISPNWFSFHFRHRDS